MPGSEVGRCCHHAKRGDADAKVDADADADNGNGSADAGDQIVAMVGEQAESARMANADRDARLKAAEARAARAVDDLRKADALRAQSQAELDEAHRERCAWHPALCTAASAGACSYDYETARSKWWGANIWTCCENKTGGCAMISQRVLHMATSKRSHAQTSMWRAWSCLTLLLHPWSWPAIAGAKLVKQLPCYAWVRVIALSYECISGLDNLCWCMFSSTAASGGCLRRCFPHHQVRAAIS